MPHFPRSRALPSERQLEYWIDLENGDWRASEEVGFKAEEPAALPMLFRRQAGMALAKEAAQGNQLRIAAAGAGPGALRTQTTR